MDVGQSVLCVAFAFKHPLLGLALALAVLLRGRRPRPAAPRARPRATGYTPLDSIYFASALMSTVGYGDVYPTQPATHHVRSRPFDFATFW